MSLWPASTTKLATCRGEPYKAGGEGDGTLSIKPFFSMLSGKNDRQPTQKQTQYCMRSPVFRGAYHVRLDEKRRLPIPSGLLQQLDPADTTIYMRSSRGAIDLYPGQRVREVLDVRDGPDDVALRLHFGTAWKATPVVSGRVVITEELLRLAGISMTDALALIGLRDHLELTTQAGWDEAKARLLGEAPTP